MRRACAGVVLALAAGCGGDRPRPTPVGPPVTPGVIVTVTEPGTNANVYAGESVRVIVTARDEARTLRGVGYVARRQGGDRMDSVSVQLPQQRVVVVDTFQLMIPATYATNTQVDIYGLALAGGTQAERSPPVTVVVIQCRAGQPGCGG